MVSLERTQSVLNQRRAPSQTLMLRQVLGSTHLLLLLQRRIDQIVRIGMAAGEGEEMRHDSLRPVIGRAAGGRGTGSSINRRGRYCASVIAWGSLANVHPFSRRNNGAGSGATSVAILWRRVRGCATIEGKT